MRTVDFPHREQVLHVDRLPPVVARQPTVVVLRTHGDLQRLPGKIDASLGVVLDGRRIHLSQSLQGRVLQGLRLGQILPGLVAQLVG